MKTSMTFTLLITMSFLVSRASGRVHSAATCSMADVQAAIDAAADGDSVTVPPGECAWSSMTEMDPCVEIADKEIALAGSGIGKTVITVNTANRHRQSGILAGGSPCKPVDISGFTFNVLNCSKGAVSLGGSCRDFRVHECRFEFNGDLNAGRGVTAYGYGLIDHCTFIKNTSNTVQSISAFGRGDDSWSTPPSFGSADAVYVEDCEFTYNTNPSDGALDAYGGARYVVRHCTIKGTNLGHHGFDSGNYRSTHSYEVYNNTFAHSGSNIAWAWRSRGGTGVLFGNTITGDYNSGFGLVYYRTCCMESHTNCSDFGRCDGANPLDGNTDATGYPCRDQPGRTSNQVLLPTYAWENTINGKAAKVFVNDPWGCANPSAGDHIQEGRDFLNGKQMPAYTPYPYPHPLTGNNPAGLHHRFTQGGLTLAVAGQSRSRISFEVFSNTSGRYRLGVHDINGQKILLKNGILSKGKSLVTINRIKGIRASGNGIYIAVLYFSNQLTKVKFFYAASP